MDRKVAFRSCFFSMVCLTLVSTPIHMLHADSSATGQTANMDKYAQLAVNNLSTVDQVMMIGAIGKASVESLKVVRADLLRSFPKGKLPHFTLEKNEFFVEGRPTGVKVTSYNPFRINYKGQLWTYDKSVAFDKNFSTLKEILSTQRKSSRLFELTESVANAAEDDNADPAKVDAIREGKAAWNGANDAILPGAVAGLATAGIMVAAGAALPVTVPFIVGGWIVASMMFGAHDAGRAQMAKDNAEKANAAKVAKLLTSPDAIVACDDNQVRISSGTSVKDRTSMIIYRVPPKMPFQTSPQRVFQYDETGKYVPTFRLKPETDSLIAEKFLGCQSPEDAQAIMDDNRRVVEEVAMLSKGETNPAVEEMSKAGGAIQ